MIFVAAFSIAAPSRKNSTLGHFIKRKSGFCPRLFADFPAANSLPTKGRELTRPMPGIVFRVRAR